ncbi:helix-turn-helix domain-containing protein [Streptomyces xiaopingdaonensis]|uniref:helix-turn-helix domain-containing protein n=1 Tax=Streptomyces xiaopingdaonensis TaxID=1565415 RepID=UPI0002E12D35|nr:helix-turn-helix transcriptional regulator [Streptomyces xiaopingdaonensis]
MHDRPLPFGPELRRLRLRAGWTLTRLAGAVHYSKSQLSKVERGLKRPSPTLARLCDEVLGAGGALNGLVAVQQHGEPAGDGTASAGRPSEGEREGDEGEVWLMGMAPDGGWFRPVPRSMARREVVAAGAASVFLLPGAGAARAEGSGVVAAARSLFGEYRRIGQASSPALLLPALIAQTHSLRGLAAAHERRTRAQLLSLAARYAEYVGWLVQETGDNAGAVWWTDQAVRLAEAGGDRSLTAYASVRRGLVALYQGDAAATVALAAAAQKSGMPWRIRGLAAQREAQGHALAGDFDACMRALDRTRDWLSREASDGGPIIGTSHLRDPAAMAAGWCLRDLGDPAGAAAELDREIAALPPHADRSHARYGVRRALAYAEAGEVEHACSLLESLLPTVDSVDSATVRSDLAQLAHVLRRHRTLRAVRALEPRVAASLHPAAPAVGGPVPPFDSPFDSRGKD